MQVATWLMHYSVSFTNTYWGRDSWHWFTKRYLFDLLNDPAFLVHHMVSWFNKGYRRLLTLEESKPAKRVTINHNSRWNFVIIINITHLSLKFSHLRIHICFLSPVYDRNTVKLINLNFERATQSSVAWWSSLKLL